MSADNTTTALRPVNMAILQAAHASHAEWLANNASGKRADFSSCLFDNTCEFDKLNFTRAIFRGSCFVVGYLNYGTFPGADFTGADLRGVEFRSNDLSNAVFDGAKLEGAVFRVHGQRPNDIRGANFRGANLTGAVMPGVDVTGCDFQSARLVNADLTDVGGLLAEKLGGADVTLCKLPEQIGEFAYIDHVNDAIHNAKVLFHALLGACALCFLVTMVFWARLSEYGAAVGGEAVEKAWDGVSKINLPLLTGSAFPTAVFQWVAPLSLTLLYFYFHAYVLQSWERMSELPAVLPDGRPFYKRVTPWVMNHLLVPIIPRLAADDTHRSAHLEAAAIFLGWLITPLTLLAMLLSLANWALWYHPLAIVVNVGAIWATWKVAEAARRNSCKLWMELAERRKKDAKSTPAVPPG